MWPELARPPLGDRGAQRSGRRAVRTDPRRRSTDHPGDHAAARLVGPVPRDRVTPPCCGTGSVTRSFSCRPAGGRDGTGSSTGRTGHRSTAASMVRRRPELARSPLGGQDATGSGIAPLRRGAASFMPTASLRQPRRLVRVVVAATTLGRASWSVPCSRQPCDHTFSMASMTSRRTGGVAQPAWSLLRAGAPQAQTTAGLCWWRVAGGVVPGRCRRRLSRLRCRGRRCGLGTDTVASWAGQAVAGTCGGRPCPCWCSRWQRAVAVRARLLTRQRRSPRQHP
jgi:hypothetical protein